MRGANRNYLTAEQLAGRSFLSAAEFGAQLGLAERTIRLWISKRRVRSIKEGGRWIPVEELHRLKRRAARG